MLKAGPVIGRHDKKHLVVDALRLEAVQELSDKPVHETDLQQVPLLQNAGKPRITLKEQ